MPTPPEIPPFKTQQEIGRLIVACPDRPGIVAALSRFLFEQGANILQSNQHSTDPTDGCFFMRVEFYLDHLAARSEALAAAFAEVAASFQMRWRLVHASRPKRLAVFVSRADHALCELFWQCRAGDLSAEIVTVIANHPDLESTVRGFGIPFHHVPVAAGQKAAAEARQIELMRDKVDTVVLARYMQIVTPVFITHYPENIINIHHSFLPAFVGPDPYSRAHERGVKLIGATAHYVTEALDAGPIIDQDVQRIDHRHDVDEMRRIGRHIERQVLARAVTWHTEDRVLVHNNKTIVFA